MKDFSAIVVNWLTARRTLGAVESIKKFYPDLEVFIVDDGSSDKDKATFFQVYKDPAYQAERVYDSSNTKLMTILGTRYIQVPTHRRHGESIDYAMQFIDSKWIFHIDSDVRLIKPGIIEYMMEGVDDTCCGVGMQKIQNPKYPKVFNAVFLFRQDLLKKYKLEMKPIYELGLETNTRYFKFLTDKKYQIKYLGEGIKDYYVHLRYEKKGKDDWDRYF